MTTDRAQQVADMLAREEIRTLPILYCHYARSGNIASAENHATELRRRDPTFNALLFGNKFQDVKDIEHLRKGLEKAGIYSDR